MLVHSQSHYHLCLHDFIVQLAKMSFLFVQLFFTLFTFLAPCQSTRQFFLQFVYLITGPTSTCLHGLTVRPSTCLLQTRSQFLMKDAYKRLCDNASVLAGNV